MRVRGLGIGDLRRYVRRMLSPVLGSRVGLHPQHDLESSGGAGWMAVGGDPYFACHIPSGVLRAGWYRLSMALDSEEAARLTPRLYVDYGQGMQEAWAIPLGSPRVDEERHTRVVLFTHDVYQMRLDPAEGRCTFSLDGLTLKRLSSPGAALRMFKDLRQRADEALPPPRWRDAWQQWRKGGAASVGTWLYELYRHRDVPPPIYERWVALYSPSSLVDLGALRPQLISVVMPTYNPPELWLRRCLDSVLAQTYRYWELCIADDASTEPHVRSVLNEYAKRDPRVRVVFREKNGHISAASNSALAIAKGELVALLDHDDELHPEALAVMASAFQAHPQWRMAYSDEDKIDLDGRRYDPYFKPDWNPDLFFGQNCVSHLGVYERDLINAIGGFREGLEGSQDWDLALRCIERLRPDQIGHVPEVLYHWRAIPGSTAQSAGEKSYAHVAGLRAVTEYFQRQGQQDTAVLEVEGTLGLFRIRHPLPSPAPLVSIVIPTRDRVSLVRQCVDSILSLTTYPNYEVIIVDNQSTDPETLTYFAQVVADQRVRVLPHNEPFNYSRINNAAIAQSRGELVCLLNNDIEVITPDWLEEMASHALRPHVGAVGAMLYYPSGAIQHAGVITGIHGVAAHPYSGMPRGHNGQMGRARLTQALTAVTAACLMVRRSVYQEVNGLDETLAVAFNDVDFCLRLRQHGYTNIWTPFAELYHHESASRGHEDTPAKRERFRREVELMRKRWGVSLDSDPAYNPNLTLAGEPFELAFPPRPWRRSGHVASSVAPPASTTTT